MFVGTECNSALTVGGAYPRGRLNKATELNALGFKIAVSDLIELTDFENGFDLADYYFEMHEM